eukprot:1161556-Pelagomonas_calceolata.AAC.6
MGHAGPEPAPTQQGPGNAAKPGFVSRYRCGTCVLWRRWGMQGLSLAHMQQGPGNADNPGFASGYKDGMLICEWQQRSGNAVKPEALCLETGALPKHAYVSTWGCSLKDRLPYTAVHMWWAMFLCCPFLGGVKRPSPLAFPPNPHACFTQSDFKDEQLLGKGGFGLVVAATNVLDGLRYAIKKIKLTDAPMIGSSRILREVHTLSRLQHPNVVAAWVGACVLRMLGRCVCVFVCARALMSYAWADPIP